MDSATDLKCVVSEVSWCLTQFAHEQGWLKDDFWIYYHVNAEWFGMNFVFVSTHFDATDERQNYRQVGEYLRRKLTKNPEILKPVTLLAWGRKQVDGGGLHSIPSDFAQFPEGFTEFWTISPMSSSASP